MKNGDKPAYPVEISFTDGEGIQTSDMSGFSIGLTKREYFAAMAMQGIIAGYTDADKANSCFIPECHYELLMQHAVQIADELLKQLDNEK